MKRWTILLCVAAAGVLAVESARANVTLVTSEAQLGPSGALDLIDWGQLGPSGTSLGSSSPVLSAGGRAATVSTSDADGLYRLDEGNGWSGAFTPNDRLILPTQSASYFPLTIQFDTPVFGAGAQIMPEHWGAFTATIEAFNGATSLGTFELAANLPFNDPSVPAPFLGVRDTAGSITKIVFGIKSPSFFDDLAVNQLRILTVPEPTNLALMGLGTLAILAGRRVRAPRRSRMAS